MAGGIRTNTGGITEITYKGKTYINSPASSNNIFDFTGNIQEWTRSRYGVNARRSRGGQYSGYSKSRGQAGFADYFTPYSNDSTKGARAQLYIL